LQLLPILTTSPRQEQIPPVLAVITPQRWPAVSVVHVPTTRPGTVPKMLEHERLSRTPAPQALLQQTASMQNPDVHCPATAHGVPFGNSDCDAVAIDSRSEGGTRTLQPIRPTSTKLKSRHADAIPRMSLIFSVPPRVAGVRSNAFVPPPGNPRRPYCQDTPQPRPCQAKLSSTSRHLLELIGPFFA
jgi:hypothetical protein